jgi:uncharacterized protein (DUF2236 family)
MSVSLDEGYFPEGRSLLRRVQGERLVGLLYGQRALILGALDPRTYQGFAIHTDTPWRPYARLAHTGDVFETVFFGTRAEADAALGRVHAMHERVEGTLRRAAGAYPRGTHYAALDPELMLWTLAVHADSARAIYEALVRPLSHAECETLWQEYRTLGELFGLDRAATPETEPAFRAYFDRRLEGDELGLSASARQGGLNVAFHLPVPAPLEPAMAIANLLIRGTLPGRARSLYDLNWTTADAAAFATVSRSLRLARRAVPGRVSRGGVHAFLQLIARTEAGRLQAGRPTWHLWA